MSAPDQLERNGREDRASRYDAWFDSDWGRYAWAVESRLLLDRVGDVAARRVLDVGCGTGRAGAAVHAAGAYVVGVDPDPAMVAMARVRVDSAVVARGERLPFRDGCFDAVVAVAVLEFVAHPAGVLGEMARVTRSPGTIVVGVLNPRSGWGLWHHRRRRAGMWPDARFVAAGDLARIGRAYGAVSVEETLRAPGRLPGLEVWGPTVERLGRRLGLPGAFRVVTIDRR